MERPYKVYEFAFNALNFFRPFLASAESEQIRLNEKGSSPYRFRS